MRKPLLLVAALVAALTAGHVSHAGAQSVTGGDAITSKGPIADGASDQQSADGRPAASKTDEKKPSSAPEAKSSARASLQEPLTVGGKFHYFAGQSFRPGSFVAAGFYTGLTMADPPKSYPREWRQGGAGFGRNYGDFVASWAALQGGKFVAASALHEDPRYFPSHSKNLFSRAAHAVRFAIVDQSDSGRPRLAVANISGALAGGFVGNAYLPDAYNNTSHALSRSGIALGGFATSNLADEFHPEMVKIARKLHIPFVK